MCGVDAKVRTYIYNSDSKSNSVISVGDGSGGGAIYLFLYLAIIVDEGRRRSCWLAGSTRAFDKYTTLKKKEKHVPPPAGRPTTIAPAIQRCE